MASGGSVTIRVLLDSSDFSKGIKDVKDQVSGLGKSDPTSAIQQGLTGATQKAGLLSKAAGAANGALKKIGSVAITTGKVAVGAIGGVATAVGALTLKGGITRAMGISEAQAKMNQLGMDTSAVMASVKASVAGTKFALNDAAGAAVTLGSAGVAAGDDMTNALKSVASTASISGAEFSEIGAIYSKVAASGKLSTEVMNQLLERGVSVTAALSRHLGKSEADIKKMVTDGKIDFKTFSDAMREYLGDASLSANSTFSGAMANVRAALARTGEAFAAPLLETFRKAFVDLIPKIDGFTASLAPLASGFAEFVGNATGALMSLVSWLLTSTDKVDEFGNKVGTIASPLQQAAEAIGGFFEGLTSNIDYAGFAAAFKGVGDALGEVFGSDKTQAANSFGSTIASMINGLIPLIEMVTPIVRVLAEAFKFVAENINWLLPVAVTLLGIISALGVAQQLGGFFSSFGSAVSACTPVCAASVPQILAMGAAALMLGIGVLAASAGMFLLVQAAIQLASSGPAAGIALVVLVAAIAGLAAVFALLGPALTAGMVGILAFGAAILMVGAGVLLACAGLTMLSSALPTISAFGIGAASSIAALGLAMLSASPGALVLGAGLLVCGAGALVAGAGMLVLAAGTLAAFAGLMLCSTPLAILAPSLMQAGAGALMMGAAMLVVAASSLMATPGLLALAACIGGVALALGLAVPAFMGLSGAMSGISGSLTASAAAMTTVVAACARMQGASTAAGNGMKNLGNASRTGATLVASACQNIDRSVASLASNVTAKVAQIKAAFSGMQLHIPSPTLGPMPHFSLSGKFDMQAGTVPTINVDWYAKGGYASKATILGGVGMGEAGGEGIVPLEGKHMYPMADAMSDRIAGMFNFAELLAELKAFHRDLPAMLADYCDIRLMISEREFGRASRNAKRQGWLD